MNQWLDPVIKNYIYYFGKTQRPVVWEVGSYDGRDGIELAQRIYEGDMGWFWQRATVVALEPNPAQATMIRQNHPEIKLLQLAASDKKGKAPFVVYEGDEGMVGCSSLDLSWKSHDFGDKRHEVVVKTDRLENLVGKAQIDIMKIDVEGHSLEVLEGFGDKLQQVKVFHVETEKWTNSCFKVKAHMMARGFTLVDETEQYGDMPDQVWVRS